MSSVPLDLLCGTAFGVQILGPLVLGVPQFWHPDTFAPAKQKADRKERLAADRAESTRGRLTPITCTACGAPVPLLAQIFPCPFCRTEVRPPQEYVEVFAVRRRVEDELRQAEELWRRSGWITSRWVTRPLRWLLVPWMLLVLFSVAWLGARGAPMAFVPTAMIAVILSIVQLFVGFPLASSLDELRDSMPRVPGAEFLRAPAESASCQHCGAPVSFAEDTLSAVCGYCGGDNFRRALAEQSRRQAEGQESAARGSLLDVMEGYRERVAGLRFSAAFISAPELSENCTSWM